MFKVSRDLSPEIVNELFEFREQTPYELRQKTQFQISQVHSVFSGTESLKSPRPKIWTLVPNEMKQLESHGKFSSIKNNENLHAFLKDWFSLIKIYFKE